MGSHIKRFIEIVDAYNLASLDTRCRQLRQMAMWGQLDEDLAELELFRIQQQGLIERQERRPNFLARAPSFEELYPQGGPDIVIGHLAEDKSVPIGFHLNGPIHAIFAGKTGAGKSVGLRRALIELHKFNQRNPDQRISIIVFDPELEYVDLPARLGNDWLCLNVHDGFRQGLDVPDRVPPDVWSATVIGDYCARSGLRFAEPGLRKAFSWGLTALNADPAKARLAADIRMLHDTSKAAPPGWLYAKDQYRQAAVQSLLGFEQGSGRIFRTFRGFDIRRDVIDQGKNVVICTPNLAPDRVFRFLVDVTLRRILMPLIQTGAQAAQRRVVVAIDDADVIASQEAEEAFIDGMSSVGWYVRLGRKFGCGLWLGLGEIGTASRQILDSPSYQIILNMRSQQSILEASRTLMLPRGAERILPGLEPGECLVRLPGTWAHAMLMHIHYVDFDGSVTPRFDSHPYVPSVPLAQMPRALESLKAHSGQHNATSMRQAKQPANEPPKLAIRLLELWIRHPWLPVPRLWDAMDESPSDEARKQAVKQLKRFTLAEFKDVRIERGSKRLMLPTEKGCKAMKVKPVVAKGGIEHAHFSAWIAEEGRKRGFDVQTEWVTPGRTRSHPVDVAWYRDSHWDVFEVVVSCTNNLVSHLVACLIDCDVVKTVTIVAAQKTQLVKIKKIVAGEANLAQFSDRIHYETIAKFVPEV